MVVHASFIVKSAQYFITDFYNEYIQTKTLYVDSIVKMSKEKWFVKDIIDHLPEYVLNQD